MRQSKQPRLREGFTLVMVLAALTLLSVLVGLWAWKVSARTAGVENRLAHQQNLSAMRASVEVLAQMVCRGDLPELGKRGKVKGCLTLGQVRVAYTAWDENMKFFPPLAGAASLPQLPDGVAVVYRGDCAGGDAGEPLLFEDVFDVPADALGRFYGPSQPGRPAVIDSLTLWSDRRLNINTAGEAAIRLACKDLPEDKLLMLLELRRLQKVKNLPALCATLHLSHDQRNVVMSRLTVASRAIAACLTAQGPLLRTDALVVVDLSGRPRIRLWKDLPPLGGANPAAAEAQPPRAGSQTTQGDL